jgi:hypothetical protein
MTDPITRRIAAALGAPELVDRLAALPASDLQSLLLAVARARAAKVTPAALLAQAERAIVAPSAVDGRDLASFTGRALGAATGFEASELAPVAPFAVDAVLGEISTNNGLPTIRPMQLVSDPTTSMALEAARRRRGDRGCAVDLVTTHRCVRLQPFDNPAFSPHFRVMAMASAGRDEGSFGFELRALRAHIAIYLRLLDALTGDGLSFFPVSVAITDSERESRRGAARLRRVDAEMFPSLAAEFPRVTFRLDHTRTQALAY